MDHVTNCILSNNSVALAVAAFVFFVTLFMVAKQWVGPAITITLLVFSLLAGLIVAEQDIIRNALSGTPTEQAKDIDIKMANFNEQILKAYDTLKAEVEIQKLKVQTLSEEVQDLKKKENL